ncbi:hypothetical protein HDF16_000322 [Granulicella aggregans]|uniref:Glycosyltransferase RgtA/B/C/D-like domain-containing protein n=1 Tax=Granulicella aggregans TaxID=474949 RepID=A0A7W8E1B9_9BACT|nr:hypothetical protein [Granulicella aggregans]MBB5055653.1 hypothetical protein [Granulicella aggregans]
MSEGLGTITSARAELESPPSKSIFDQTLILLLTALGGVALILIVLVPLHFLPAEDAAILFQYSRNLASHGAITFLANGPRVEGATDFAWMALVAAGMRVGLAPLWTTTLFNVVSILTIAALLLRLADLRLTVRRLLLITGSIALVPQILAAASGFAVLTDAALLTALVFCTVKGRVAPAALFALALCLFRPDGVLFVAPLLAGLIVQSPSRGRSSAVIGGFFVVPGVLYFLWRWHYFGEFLPLPFLVKSDTPRFAGLFVPKSIHDSLVYLEFAAILIAPLLILRRAKHLWLTIPLVLCPTLFYWAMRLDQNVGGRFFFYIPLFAAILLALNWVELSTSQVVVLRTGLIAWLVLLGGPQWREIRTFRDGQFTEVKAISEALGRLPVRGTILTSEAGFLPYFSGWTTYDAWGLNTPTFAHRFFQSSDVVALAPDLIVFHPDWTESCVASPSSSNYTARTWQHLTRNLVFGAAQAHYELWLTSYGSEFYRQRKHWQYGEGDRECWLVRTDSPLHGEIAQILQQHHGIEPEQSLNLEKLHDQVQR